MAVWQVCPVAVVLGVDGCRGGWLGARVADRRHVRWLALPDADAVLAVDAVVTGIDIPIGLPDAERRACDVAARARLGPRRSAVFPAPVRAVLDATSYPDACRRSRAARGVAVSRQTWNIVPRIADVDAALQARPRVHERVVEVHPELSFRMLAGVPLAAKHTAAGAALACWLDVAAALRDLPPGAPRPDALDALAAAWSAQRWLQGAAVRLPAAEVGRDRVGHPMRIVA
ncbi:MAG: DUF429 domain-containing protein [Carbonactinosporaceae bacterium]